MTGRWTEEEHERFNEGKLPKNSNLLEIIKGHYFMVLLFNDRPNNSLIATNEILSLKLEHTIFVLWYLLEIASD